jgi:DNA processing protein
MQQVNNAFLSYKLLLVRLWLTAGAGAVFIQKLYSLGFGFDLENQAPTVTGSAKLMPLEFCTVAAEQLASWTGLPVSQIRQVQQALASENDCANFLQALKKLNAHWLCILDPEYPPLLRHIYVPPAVLTWQGNLALNWAKSLALVGSRRAGRYAATCLDLLLPELLAAGFVTVSGGAIGVDSMVHSKTLSLNAATVVVLGSGLAQVYPAENRKLFAQVAANNGAVISIFPPHTVASKGTFPARNRIISGLTPACLVVQAAEKSGALITASFALDQNRDVLTIPGPIDDLGFVGNHKLLRQGAHLITSGSDLLTALGVTDTPPAIVNFDNQRQQSNVFALPSVAKTTDPLLAMLERPIGLEELAMQLQLNIVEVQERLFDFQLEGCVTQNAAGTWQRL